MRLNSCGSTVACLAWFIVTVCQAWEDHSNILEHLDDFFDWNAPPRLDDLEGGAVTDPSFPSPHPLNHPHQIEFSSHSNQNGVARTTHQLPPISPPGFPGMSQDTVDHLGIPDLVLILPRTSREMMRPESERWVLPNDAPHLSSGGRQPSPIENLHSYAGSQSASSEARNVFANHVDRRRPLMVWSTLEGDYPQYYGHSSTASAATHSESGPTKRSRSSELPVKFGMPHELVTSSRNSQSLSSLPVVDSQTGWALTSESPPLPTQPESAHPTPSPNLDRLSFSDSVILGARPVAEVNFVRSWVESGSSSPPATLRHQSSQNPSGGDASTSAGIDQDVESQHQNLISGAESGIDGSKIPDSLGRRIDPAIPTSGNLHQIEDDERRELYDPLAEVFHLENLEFDENAFRKDGGNKGMKEWMRIPIIESITRKPPNKLRLSPDNEAYLELITLVNWGHGTPADWEQFSKTKAEREHYLADAKCAFFRKQAVWSLHWLIHKRIDVQLYLHRLRGHEFLRMDGTLHLFLYYVEMIIAIVPRPQMDEAWELKCACDLFVKHTKRLQVQWDVLEKPSNPQLADTVRSSKKGQSRGEVMPYSRLIWTFLTEWIKKNRPNLIRPGGITVGNSAKSFFNDIFCLTIRNLNRRYERLLTFESRGRLLDRLRRQAKVFSNSKRSDDDVDG